MASTSLIIKSTKNGVSEQKSVTYVNPAATNANLKTFAQKITAMSNHTYTGATRVDKTDVDEAGGGSGKIIPTLTANCVEGTVTITYNGDGELSGYYMLYNEGGSLTITNNTTQLPDNGGSTTTFIICASEGTNYAAAWVASSYTQSTSG